MLVILVYPSRSTLHPHPPYLVPFRMTCKDCITWAACPFPFQLGLANGRQELGGERRERLGHCFPWLLHCWAVSWQGLCNSAQGYSSHFSEVQPQHSPGFSNHSLLPAPLGLGTNGSTLLLPQTLKINDPTRTHHLFPARTLTDKPSFV